jgi:hypothetical protein
MEYKCIRRWIRCTRWSRLNDEVIFSFYEAIKAAANEINYEDKYKVVS